MLNVVHGDQEAVGHLLEHPAIDGVSFVGSTPVARHIHRTASANGKRVQALGGAKNHMIVLPDADIDLAADAAVSAGYGSAGEGCMAVSVVVAVGASADRLVDAIAMRTERISIGDGAPPVQKCRFESSSKGSGPICVIHSPRGARVTAHSRVLDLESRARNLKRVKLSSAFTSGVSSCVRGPPGRPTSPRAWSKTFAQGEQIGSDLRLIVEIVGAIMGKRAPDRCCGH